MSNSDAFAATFAMLRKLLKPYELDPRSSCK